MSKKIPVYSEQTYNDAMTAFRRLANKSNALNSLEEKITKLDAEICTNCELKNIFLHSLLKFITEWQSFVKSIDSVPSNVKARILHTNVFDWHDCFSRFFYYINTIRVKKGSHYDLINDVHSYMHCTMKAVYQNERRKNGLDTNSKKF